jgi:anti-sigma factor RsiW
VIYISVPRAAISTLLHECDHGPRTQRGCHQCYRRAEARAQLQAYLRATPPNAVPTGDCEMGPGAYRANNYHELF